MLSVLIRFSIRYYGIVMLLALLILTYGGYRFTVAGLDIFPDFAPKQVIIQTEALGYSAEQVEVLVTQPLEKGLSGLAGLETIRSESIQGLSVVKAIFHEHSEIYRNRQLVSERLTTLNLGVAVPRIVPLSSASATVLTLGLQSASQDLMQLRSVVDWVVVPRLLAVPGVADVNVFGGDIKQLQIQVRPEQLRRFHLSMEDVITAAEQAGKIQAGGFIENPNQRFTLEVSGYAVDPKQLQAIVVQRAQGENITLGQLADINFAPEPPISAAQIMGKPGVVLMVIGQREANTLTVSRAVEQAMLELQSVFKAQGIVSGQPLFRPADYIERSVHNLSGHLLLGGLFVLVVLLLFLFNVRTALIAALAIPVSLCTAVIVLLEAGVNLNIMVLGGLAIALGEVVDDAIIDTENIFRRLRENRMLAQPLSVEQVVYQASIEVRSSVVYASFIVALVFVPLITLSGVAGRLFAPLGMSYILAILMSLLVALSLTPALCYALLAGRQHILREPPLVKYLQNGYARILLAISQYFKPLILLGVLLCALGVYAFSQLGHKFLPELREGHYIVHTASLPGTALEESLRLGSQLTAQFQAIAGVVSVSQWAGRAERGADTYGSHYSEYEVRLQPMSGREQQAVLQQLRAILERFPGIVFEANTFLTERINETLSGYTAPVVVNIYGNNLDELDAKARAVAAVMQGIAGATDIQLRSPPGTPVVNVQLDLGRLQHYGLRPQQVMDALQAAYGGRVVGRHYAGNQPYAVNVILPKHTREDPDRLGELPLRSAEGLLLNLAQVADIYQTEGRYNILHQQARRYQAVTCSVKQDDLGVFLATLKATLAQQVALSPGMYFEFTGAAVEQAAAKKALWLQALMVSMGVLLLIYIAIGNLRQMLLTLVNLPFSLLGGVAAIVFTQASFSVGSMVGFITLFGITVRNSIMLLSHYQYLVTVEHKAWNFATMLQGAQERLPSILMTALVTALAMFPIAFDSDNPGREIMGPMAAIIIGGLASSTVLNLLLLPVILLRYAKFKTSVAY